MTYTNLKNIKKQYIGTNLYTLPQNSHIIASQLNLRVKNSIECKNDYHTVETPLLQCNAIYAIYHGEYVIYYDENYAYRNFAIAHEIAHHLLGHKSDGAMQHHDANLLAAMLVAPEELIYKHKIKNAIQLSEICKIPIDIAEEYWNTINYNNKHFNIKQFKTIFTIIFCILIIILTAIFYNINNKSNINTLNYITCTSFIQQQKEQTVYVSKLNEKYQNPNRRHINKKIIYWSFL